MSTSAHPAPVTPCARAPVVAVVNHDETMIRIFRLMLDTRGFPTVASDAEKLGDTEAGATRIQAFLDQHNPRVVVFDLPYPYDRYWELFQRVRRSGAAARRRFVLTTTHPTQVRSWVQPEDTVTIVEVPFGTEELVAAVRQALDPSPADERC